MSRRGGIKTGSISSSTRWGIPAQAIKAGRQLIPSQVQAAHFALYAHHGRSAVQHQEPTAVGVQTQRRPDAQLASATGETFDGRRATVHGRNQRPTCVAQVGPYVESKNVAL